MGFLVVFDLLMFYGYDLDYEMLLGEVGKCGVVVDMLVDMEVFFDGILIDQIMMLMMINFMVLIFFVMYLVVVEKQGVDFVKGVCGILQNDIFKEYIVQKEYIYLLRLLMCFVIDQFVFVMKYVLQWNMVLILGYYICEVGLMLFQEFVFILCDGMEYVQYGMDVGFDVDVFVFWLLFFFNSYNDFFEEIVKFCVVWCIWVEVMCDCYGVKDLCFYMMCFYIQMVGVLFILQQLVNNVVRIVVQVFVVVFGGIQLLYMNVFDEILVFLIEESVMIVL